MAACKLLNLIVIVLLLLQSNVASAGLLAASRGNGFASMYERVSTPDDSTYFHPKVNLDINLAIEFTIPMPFGIPDIHINQNLISDSHTFDPDGSCFISRGGGNVIQGLLDGASLVAGFTAASMLAASSPLTGPALALLPGGAAIAFVPALMLDSLFRYCARYTIAGRFVDHGCSRYDTAGNCIAYNDTDGKAKLCIYNDPWDWPIDTPTSSVLASMPSLTSAPSADSLGLTSLLGSYMPFHYQERIPSGVTTNQLLDSMISMKLSKTHPASVSGMYFLVAPYLSTILSSNIPYGNMVVIDGDGASGCVDVPEAPPPPPFCNPMCAGISQPTVSRVCTENIRQANGTYLTNSVSGNVCAPAGVLTRDSATGKVITPKTNDFNVLQNSYETSLIRVSFADFQIPVCSSSTNSMCVNIIYGTSTKYNLHYKYNDFIETCNINKTNTPCVSFNPSGFMPSAPSPYRLLYINSKAQCTNTSPCAPTPWYGMSPTFDSNGNITSNVFDSSSPLEIYGIDGSQFYDLGMHYSGPNSTPTSLPATIQLGDRNKSSILINALIDEVNHAGQVGVTYQYASEVNKSFVARPPAPKPFVGSCNQVFCDPNNLSNCSPSVGCTSTNINPQMVICLGNPAICGSVGENTMGSPTTVSLYGNAYRAIATDSDYQIPNSVSATPIKGSYTTDTPSVYNGGLEYNLASGGGNSALIYSRGASKICVYSGYNNITRQIIAKNISLLTSALQNPSVRISDRIYPKPNAFLPDQVIPGNTILPFNNYCYPGRDISSLTAQYPCNSCNGTLCPIDPKTNFTTDSAQISLPTEVNRPMNPLEAGLCAPVPYPVCPEITSSQGVDGFAYWSSATAGNAIVSGTCPKGGNGSPTRQCLFGNGLVGTWGPVKDPCNMVNVCPAIDTPTMNNGYTTWPMSGFTLEGRSTTYSLDYPAGIDPVRIGGEVIGNDCPSGYTVNGSGLYSFVLASSPVGPNQLRINVVQPDLIYSITDNDGNIIIDSKSIALSDLWLSSATNDTNILTAVNIKSKIMAITNERGDTSPGKPMRDCLKMYSAYDEVVSNELGVYSALGNIYGFQAVFTPSNIRVGDFVASPQWGPVKNPCVSTAPKRSCPMLPTQPAHSPFDPNYINTCSSAKCPGIYGRLFIPASINTVTSELLNLNSNGSGGRRLYSTYTGIEGNVMQSSYVEAKGFAWCTQRFSTDRTCIGDMLYNLPTGSLVISPCMGGLAGALFTCNKEGKWDMYNIDQSNYSGPLYNYDPNTCQPSTIPALGVIDIEGYYTPLPLYSSSTNNIHDYVSGINSRLSLNDFLSRIPLEPPKTCQATTMGNATWQVGSVGQSYTGTCSSGYSPTPVYNCNSSSCSRGTVNPTATCNSDGTWGIVNNPCMLAGACPSIYVGNYFLAPSGPQAKGAVINFSAGSRVNSMHCNGEKACTCVNGNWSCYNDFGGAYCPAACSAEEYPVPCY